MLKISEVSKSIIRVDTSRIKPASGRGRFLLTQKAQPESKSVVNQ